jgi:hypothetical protein
MEFTKFGIWCPTVFVLRGPAGPLKSVLLAKEPTMEYLNIVLSVGIVSLLAIAFALVILHD